MEHTVPPTKMVTHNFYLQNHSQDIDRSSSKTELITEHTVLTLPGKTGQQLFPSQISSWDIYNWVHKPEMLICPVLEVEKWHFAETTQVAKNTKNIISFKLVTAEFQTLKFKYISMKFHFRSRTSLPVLGKGSRKLLDGSTSLLLSQRDSVRTLVRWIFCTN